MSSSLIRAAARRRSSPWSRAWNRRFASTLRSRSSVDCWNTTPRRASAPTRCRRMSSPSIAMRPPSGTNSPVSSWKSVVLPAPFGPSKATNSPGPSASVTPSSALTDPYDFARPRPGAAARSWSAPVGVGAPGSRHRRRQRSAAPARISGWSRGSDRGARRPRVAGLAGASEVHRQLEHHAPRPRREEQHAVRDGQRLAELVSHVEHGRACSLPQLDQLPAQAARRRRVERDQRLIQEESSGSTAKARARATRRCMPPERRAGVGVSSPPRARRREGDGGRARWPWALPAQHEPQVVEDRQPRHQTRGLEHHT